MATDRVLSSRSGGTLASNCLYYAMCESEKFTIHHIPEWLLEDGNYKQKSSSNIPVILHLTSTRNFIVERRWFMVYLQNGISYTSLYWIRAQAVIVTPLYTEAHPGEPLLQTSPAAGSYHGSRHGYLQCWRYHYSSVKKIWWSDQKNIIPWPMWTTQHTTNP